MGEREVNRELPATRCWLSIDLPLPRECWQKASPLFVDTCTAGYYSIELESSILSRNRARPETSTARCSDFVRTGLRSWPRSLLRGHVLRFCFQKMLAVCFD